MTEKYYEYMEEFELNEPTKVLESQKVINGVKLPEQYISFLEKHNGGEGSIGENSYLALWKAEELEEHNEGYGVSECLPNTVFIGSDGGNTAYGIDKNGNFFEIDFLDMDTEEIEIVANSFDGFIKYHYDYD